MTALSEYERLEASGLWRATPDGQRQEVILTFGDATLVIADSRSMKALSHWSLPAMVRRNPGKRPAVYAPSPEPGEALELDDDTMIAAIEKVHAMIEARRPHPGRLRGILLSASGLAALTLAVFWLPGALLDHTARVAPPAKRAEIGADVLRELSTLTGAPCHSPAGDAALNILSRRLSGPREIIILPEALEGALRLPGQKIVVGRPLVENVDTPEVIAGTIIATTLAQSEHDPLRDMLDWVGVVAAFKLLTTGELPAGALKGYGAYLLQNMPPLPASEPLLEAFRESGVSITPYAFAVDPSGETVLSLIEADPFKGAPAPQPVLADAQWVALQDICSK